MGGKKGKRNKEMEKECKRRRNKERVGIEILLKYT